MGSTTAWCLITTATPLARWIWEKRQGRYRYQYRKVLRAKELKQRQPHRDKSLAHTWKPYGLKESAFAKHSVRAADFHVLRKGFSPHRTTQYKITSPRETTCPITTQSSSVPVQVD